jgi:hypothetical protein
VNTPDPSNANIPNLAVVSLAAAEVTASHSTNRADTFSTPDVAAAGVPFDDRMWIDASMIPITSVWSTTILEPPLKFSCNARTMEG